MQIQRLTVRRQVGLPLVYKDAKSDLGYRVGLLVEDPVIVEIKSVEALNDVHIVQLLTLKLCKLELGLLMNFNVSLFKDGIKRLVTTREPRILCA